MTHIKLSNVYSKIYDLIDDKIIEQLDNKLSYYVEGYNFMRSYTHGFYDQKTNLWKKWDGKTHLLSKYLQFQTGLLPDVEEVLKKNKIEYIVEDERPNIKLGPELQLSTNCPYQLRDYQEQAIEAAITHKAGVLKLATGAGKTFLTVALIARLNLKTVIYLPTLDLLYDMKNCIEKFLDIECGIVGDGHCSIRHITVATPWSVAISQDKKHVLFDDDESAIKEKFDTVEKHNIQKMVKDCEAFIIDECQILGSASAQLIAKSSINAVYRLAESATPHRDSQDDILIHASTGPTLIDIDSTALINRGILVPPKIFFITVPEYHKKLPENYQVVYDKYIVNNDIRNEAIVGLMQKLFDNGRKTLILVKRKKHGAIIMNMLPDNIRSIYLDGSNNAEERAQARQDFTNNKLDVIVASIIFETGIDLPNITGLIIASGGKSSVRTLQRIGRSIRSFPGKVDSWVFDFVDHAPYLFAHSKKRYAICKTQPGFIIKTQEPLDR